jgi:sortase A
MSTVIVSEDATDERAGSPVGGSETVDLDGNAVADSTAAEPGSPVGPFRQVVGVALVVLSALGLSLAVQLVLLGSFQHRAAQQRAFDKLRKELAEGTGPLGQTDSSGRLLAVGTPVGLVDIPSIHVHQVVLEGTTSGVLMSGPGHLRGTVMPGLAGTSTIFGRAAAYGGPFKRLHQLHVGARIIVTTQAGVSTFQVIDVRRPGDLAPTSLTKGKGRLLLITARGTPFIPSGVLRVDADLVTPTLGSASVDSSVGGDPAERPLGTDAHTLWELVFLLQLMVVVAVGIVWSWARWGHHQTWIVFFPVTVLVGYLVSVQFMRLLPNLM